MSKTFLKRSGTTTNLRLLCPMYKQTNAGTSSGSRWQHLQPIKLDFPSNINSSFCCTILGVKASDKWSLSKCSAAHNRDHHCTLQSVIPISKTLDLQATFPALKVFVNSRKRETNSVSTSKQHRRTNTNTILMKKILKCIDHASSSLWFRLQVLLKLWCLNSQACTGTVRHTVRVDPCVFLIWFRAPK